MERFNFKSIGHHARWILHVMGYAIALGIFTLILSNRSPNFLRPLSMNVRFGFTWIIPLFSAILYFSFRLKGWLGHWVGLSVTLSLFALALAGMWASGHTQSTVISGLIPIYDAQSYYVDSLRLLAGRSVLEFSAARPFFAGFLATLLAITSRNLMSALIILTVLNGLTSYYAAREVEDTHGSLAAVYIIIFIFLYYRYRTIGTVMSENLGFPLGILGITLIWRGISKHSPNLVLYGLFIHTVGLNARPGPFFILPAMLLWGSWYFKKEQETFSWPFFLKGLGALMSGFALNLIIIRLIATPSAAPFSQFSYAFYGLASGGKSFIYVFEIHPELLNLMEPEKSRTIYRLAFEQMRNHPLYLFQGIVYNLSTAFSNSDHNIFSYISGESLKANMLVHWCMYLLCVLGLIRWIKKHDPYTSFVIVAVAGILASIPFVPPGDAYGMRLYAASIIALGLFSMMGMVFALEHLKINLADKPLKSVTDSRILIWFSSVLSLILIAGPLMIKGSDPAPTITNSHCQPGSDSIVIQYDPGSSIHTIREKDLTLDWLPFFHQSLFKRNAHHLPDIYLAEWLETLSPYSTLFYTLDYRSNQAALVVIPSSLLPNPGAFAELCGIWEKDPSLNVYSVFIATDATILQDN